MNEIPRARQIDSKPAWKGRLDRDELEQLDFDDPAAIRRLVCAGFCTFFSPAENGEEGCGGVLFLERALPGVVGRSVGLDVGVLLARAVSEERPVTYDHDEKLEALICVECGYRNGGDCDHRNPTLSAAQRLEPCGGYVVAAFILSAGAELSSGY